ncbi:MAG TPA: polysaccharide pyruvyl transferase CsaB [Halanaerobiaceae bacterium]|nr:polysaccharide pyruvyl transferase CsaB [Halanaerobiaceae bacterium]
MIILAKLIFSGYFGFDNLGDEAILLSMVTAFRSIEPDLELLVLSGNPAQTRERYQLAAINRMNILAFIRELKDCDLFISGGGSLLQDITSWKSIPFYLGQVILAQLMGKRTAFYAQGIGPVKSRFYQSLIKWVMKRADYISVRDALSRKLLLEWGLEADRIKIVVDPVFAIKELFQEEKAEDDISNENSNKRPLIGVSVRPWGDNAYINNLVEAVSSFAREVKGDILVLPFHAGEDQEISREVQEKLLATFQEHNYAGKVLLEANSSPLEMLEKYREMDVFLGVRLHSLIFAAIANIPFVGLEYDPKIRGFIQLMGINSGFQLENLDAGELYRVISSVYAHSAQFKEVLQAKSKLFARYTLQCTEELLKGVKQNA